MFPSPVHPPSMSEYVTAGVPEVTCISSGSLFQRMQFVIVGEEESRLEIPPPWVVVFSEMMQFMIVGEESQ